MLYHILSGFLSEAEISFANVHPRAKAPGISAQGIKIMEEKRIKIFVIAQEQSLQDYLTAMLIGENYEVKSYARQDTALNELEKDVPDLIISDFQSPDINGVEICKYLRKTFLFSHIPLIFLLEDVAQLEEAKLIYAGGDDYIHRASLEHELILRVKLNIFRILRQQDVNPITRLPGQASLLKELQKRIDSKTQMAVCHLDLYKFREFNQRYGLKRGDELIRYVGALITESLRYYGSPDDFLAHPAGDNFFFITSPMGVDDILDKIIIDFDRGVLSFYSGEDRERGFTVIKNREGGILKVSLTRIYIGIATNEHFPFVDPTQIIQIASELKDFAQKSFEKSMFAKERRKEWPFS